MKTKETKSCIAENQILCQAMCLSALVPIVQEMCRLTLETPALVVSTSLQNPGLRPALASRFGGSALALCNRDGWESGDAIGQRDPRGVTTSSLAGATFQPRCKTPPR